MIKLFKSKNDEYIKVIGKLESRIEELESSEDKSVDDEDDDENDLSYEKFKEIKEENDKSKENEKVLSDFDKFFHETFLYPFELVKTFLEEERTIIKNKSGDYFYLDIRYDGYDSDKVYEVAIETDNKKDGVSNKMIIECFNRIYTKSNYYDHFISLYNYKDCDDIRHLIENNSNYSDILIEYSKNIRFLLYNKLFMMFKQSMRFYKKPQNKNNNLSFLMA